MVVGCSSCARLNLMIQYACRHYYKGTIVTDVVVTPVVERVDRRIGKKAVTALTHEEALRRAQAAHADKDYDWSQFQYTNARSKVTVVCKTDGPFHIVYDSLMRGRGCRHCGYRTKRVSSAYTSEEFVSKVSDKISDCEGGKYDYSLVNYVNRSTPVTVICALHGEFPMHPGNAINGDAGCPECGKIKAHDHFRKSLDKVKSEIEALITDDRYTVKDLSDCKSNKSYITMNCSEHGDWLSKPNWMLHVGYVMCPTCSGSGVSRGEKELCDFIRGLGVDNVVANDRKTIGPLELDVYLPDYRIAFEFNGVYHHSDKFKGDDYHLDKTTLCAQRGIRLVHIFSDEWDFKGDITRAKIAHILGKDNSPVVPTRKTVVSEVPYLQAKQFFSEHHIQGAMPNQRFCYGLFLEGELVAAASFGTVRFVKETDESEVELYRYATKYRVPGGLSKILKHFKKMHKSVARLVSYSDRRWSVGDVYLKLGFSKVGTSKPSYYYTNSSGYRYDRQRFMKQNLAKLHAKGLLKSFNPALTEVENCANNGYRRIFNCGMDCWELKLD